MKLQRVAMYLIVFLYIGCLFWLDVMFELSPAQIALLYLGAVVLMFLIVIVPAFVTQQKLNAIVAKHGMYSEEYAQKLEALAKDCSPSGEAIYDTTLIAVYLGMGDLKRAEQAVMALPMNWAEDKKYRLVGDNERNLLYKGLYFNNAMCCYYKLNNLEKMEMYCQTGGNYIWQYLQSGQKEEMKVAFRETLAAYHFMRKEYDKARELLGQIDIVAYPKVEAPVKQLKARILMANGQYEEAKELLLGISEYEGIESYRMDTEKLLAECEENLQKL